MAAQGNKFTLRPFIDSKDLGPIKDLDEQMGEQKWSASSWDSFFNGPNIFRCFVAQNHNFQIIGFTLFTICEEEEGDLWHLLKIVVDKTYRKQGVGGMMMEAFSEHKMFLEVEASNLSAINLYQRFGFVITHRAKNYYGQSKDALKMIFHPKMCKKT